MALIAMLLLCVTFFCQPAWSYSDISSASYYSQLILGLVFGGTVSLKVVPGLVADWFKNLSKGGH